MIFKVLLLVAIAVAVVNCKEVPNDPVYHFLEEFLKMAEDHKLNISLIVSETKYHENVFGDRRKVKSVSDTAMMFPPLEVQVKENKLNADVTKKWIEKIKTLPDEVMYVGVRTADVNSKEVHVDDVVGGYDIDKSGAYQWFTNFDKKLGRQAYKVDNPNLVIWHNIKVQKPDKHMVQLVTSDITVIEVKRGPKMNDDTVDIIKAIVPNLWHMFDDDTEYSRAIVRVLDQKIPEMDWNVIVGVTDFHVKTDNWVVVKVIDQSILVYSGK